MVAYFFSNFYFSMKGLYDLFDLIYIPDVLPAFSCASAIGNL